MNILSKVTWKAMWQNKTRTIVTIVGVILSAAMFMAITSMAASGMDYLRRYCIAADGDYYCSFNGLDGAELETLSNLPEVSEIGTMKSIGYCAVAVPGDPYSTDYLISACNSTYFQNMPLEVTEGRLPQNSSEILLDGDNLGPLKRMGYSTEIGATITLPVTLGISNAGVIAIGPEDEAVEAGEYGIVEKTYTIVGIGEISAGPQVIGADAVFPAWLYIYDDGAQGETLTANAFVKTVPIRVSIDLFHSDYGTGRGLQTEYLATFGVIDGPINILTLLAVIVGGLCSIVLIGSVSLIYNAFSISVTERTRQFGLLSSVGATKKQLRRSVLFEGLLVGSIGIPLGLLAGFGGAAVLVSQYQREIDNLLSSLGEHSGISVRVVFSWQAILIAAAIALVTVLLSAWIPARRATKIPPLEAIRQTEDYKIGGKLPKAKKSWLFGFSGSLAKKYYAASRKKYRSVVVSLAVSVALFVATMSITQLFLDVTLLNIDSDYNYDLKVYNDPEAIAQLQEQPFVEKSVLVEASWTDSCVAMDPDMYSQAVLDSWDKLYFDYEWLNLEGIQQASIFYLEDEAFAELLCSCGIRDTEAFLAEGKALVLNLTTSMNITTGEGQEAFLVKDMEMLSPNVAALTLSPGYYISDICPYDPYSYIDYGDSVYLDSHGALIKKWVNNDTGEIICQLMQQEERDGVSGIAYYLYDPETETAEEEAFYFWEGEEIRTIPIGGTVDGEVFGVQATSRYNLSLVLPLSAMDDPEKADLAFTVNDYNGAIAYLEEQELSYSNFISYEMETVTIVTTIQTFVSCFVAVISLICAANIFNTVSTNVSLRRRDFGMLQSLGMQRKQLLAMLVRECMSIGIRSLGWGLGVGLFLHAAFCQITRSTAYIPFALPWGVMGIATLAVVILVAAATAYAFFKMKKDNPIETIRQENL